MFPTQPCQLIVIVKFPAARMLLKRFLKRASKLGEYEKQLVTFPDGKTLSMLIDTRNSAKEDLVKQLEPRVLEQDDDDTCCKLEVTFPLDKWLKLELGDH